MPIKGLSDRGASFPEIGRIRKGAPKGERKPGKDLDHFRFVFDESEQDTAMRWVELYTEKPRRFRAFLPFDRIEDCWDAWLEAYVASGLVYRSDGEHVVYWVDPQTGERKVQNGEPLTECVAVKGEPVAVYATSGGKKIKVQAKATGRLKLILPELYRFAYMTLTTTSQYDIANISSQLEAIGKIAQMAGRGGIASVPLIVRRRKQSVLVPNEDGTRFRKDMWLISIEADPEWSERQVVAMIEAATPKLIETKYQLPEPEEDDDIEEGEWEDAGNGGDENDEEPIGDFDSFSWRDEVMDELIANKLVPATDKTDALGEFVDKLPFDSNHPVDWPLIWVRIYNDAKAEGLTKVKAWSQANERWADWAVANPEEASPQELPSWVDKLIAKRSA